MDFLGFVNGDFDFFKKKNTLDKQEYDERKEELKRHFREFCYQVQKYYHSTTGGTLLLDKDFQGLNKNKNCIMAKSPVYGIEILEQVIEMNQDKLSIYLVCPKNGGNSIDFNTFKGVLENNKNIFTKFFKENKEMCIVLYSRNVKKTSGEEWAEKYKFDNNELCADDYSTLIDNMEKLQSQENGTKVQNSIRIRTQFSKNYVIKIGKTFVERACSGIIKQQNLISKLNG